VKLNYSKLFVFGLVMIMLTSLSVVTAQQPTTYDISGNVQDQNGDSVNGAEVIFRSQTDSTEYFGNTDGVGNFNIYNVPEGSYDVDINAGGYDFFQQSGYYVDGGNTYFDFSIASQDTGGGGGGEKIDPFGEVMGEFEQIILYLLMAVALFYLLLIIITIMTIAIFVRLGKIKKSNAELRDTIKDLNNKTMPSQPQAQPQYQQPMQEQYQQPPPE